MAEEDQPSQFGFVLVGRVLVLDSAFGAADRNRLDFFDHLNGPLTIEELTTMWRRFSDTDHIFFLDYNKEWSHLCRLVQELPRLTKVNFFFLRPVPVPDDKVAILLKHVARRVAQVELIMYTPATDGMTLTFLQVGNLMQLQYLHLACWVGGPGDRLSFETLADSLEGLPHFRRLHMGFWLLVKACFEPLFCALGGVHEWDLDIRREGKRFMGGDPSAAIKVPPFPEHYFENNFGEYTIGQELWYTRVCGPTAAQMRKQEKRKLSKRIRTDPENVKFDARKGLGYWLEDMIVVQDQLDCFHFLFSQLPPHMCYNSRFWNKPVGT